MRLFAGLGKSVAYKFNVHFPDRTCPNPECRAVFKPSAKNQVVCGRERCKAWRQSIRQRQQTQRARGGA